MAMAFCSHTWMLWGIFDSSFPASVFVCGVFWGMEEVGGGGTLVAVPLFFRPRISQ